MKANLTLDVCNYLKLPTTLDQCANAKVLPPLAFGETVLVPSIPCILDFARIFLFSEWRWDFGRASSKKEATESKIQNTLCLVPILPYSCLW